MAIESFDLGTLATLNHQCQLRPVLLLHTKHQLN
jgi:hypothetical protein